MVIKTQNHNVHEEHQNDNEHEEYQDHDNQKECLVTIDFQKLAQRFCEQDYLTPITIDL